MRKRDEQFTSYLRINCTPVAMMGTTGNWQRIRDLSKKGYDTERIHQRSLSICVRNELTTEWHERGMQQDKKYDILTDEIAKTWSGNDYSAI